MNVYEVNLKLQIRAENLEEAEGIAEGAIEHLLDTFNDDESLSAFGFHVLQSPES